MDKEMILNIDVNKDNKDADLTEVVEYAEVDNSEAVAIDINDDEKQVEQIETIEYVEVNEPKAIEIEVEEAVGWTNSDGNITHASLPDKHDPDLHPVESIIGLYDQLHKLSSMSEDRDGITIYHDQYSAHSGFAEFREWLDDDYYKEYIAPTGGVGYFVSLVTSDGNISGGNAYISVCRKEKNDGTFDVLDVYGVTVDESGFCGYQSKDYDVLNPSSTNKKNDYDYAMVCLLGNVQVRITDETLDTIKVGDYVVPNELGYAEKSKNDIGFKVISKGTIEKGWNYVSIALVPQNDNISRIMKEVEGTKVSLNNVNLQLGNMSDTITGIQGTTIQISGKVDGFQGVLDETVPKVEEQLKIAQDTSTKAQEVAKDAEAKINEVASKYAEALNQASDAHKALYGTDDNPGVLSDITTLKDNIKPLASWEGKDGTYGVAGFVAKANENSTYIANLTQTFTDNGTDLTAVIQKNDKNGAAIQHLVSHVDKYILGRTSPINGLSLDETTIMNPGTIYVPTEEHSESYSDTVFITFEEGKSYIWQAGDTGEYMWVEYKPVSTSAGYFEGTNEGDLWYCWKGVLEGNSYTYSPDTLYYWDANKKIWVPVASGNYNSNVTIGLINQTADKLTSVYTDLNGKMSTLEQTVEGISTTVQNEVKDQISSIHQTAEEIMMGVYEPDGSSSLGLLLDGMNSNSINVNIVKIKTVKQSPVGFKDFEMYDEPPVWNGERFVFAGEQSETGIYYFIPEEGVCYYEAIGRQEGDIIVYDSYAVYGVNNTTMANLHTRVTNTESEVESWTRFQKGQSETMTSINQTSLKGGAAISSMVYGDFRECVQINIELTEEEKEAIKEQVKYGKSPIWNNATKKFEFNDTDEVYEGVYCFALNNIDDKSYYKLLYNGTEITGYEKYEMKSSPYSSIVQKVDDEGNASIGLVAGNDDAMGGMVVNTINDKSTILIQADKIGVDGTTIFSDTSDYGTTTISGDFIKTGVITSNNYSGPVTYTRFGVLVDTVANKLVQSSMDTCLYFAPIATGIEYEVLPRQQYYTVLSVNMNSELKVLDTHDDMFKSDINGYVVSAEKFDLVPLYGSIVGTKFDLNDGTIFSRNLSLDGKGDLTIKGKITATSGYIGNGTNGFTIGVRGLICVATPDIFTNMENYNGSSTFSAPQGTYCFYYNDDPYLFTTTQRIYEGNVITVDVNEGNMYINGVFHTKITAGYSDKATLIIMTQSDCYSLWNDQWTYKGDNSRNHGVYIGPDGIGLGNGNFWVDNCGELNTYGDVFMYGGIDPVTKEPIKIVSIADGNLQLAGNITLGGAITWNMENSPVKTLYSSNYEPDEGFYPDDTSVWHETFTVGDLYMTMSFDGGTNWNTPTKITGTDAAVTPENVFNALTEEGKIQGIFGYKSEDNNSMQLYINAEYIQAGTLSGMTLEDAYNGHTLTLGTSSGYADLTYKRQNGDKLFQIYDAQTVTEMFVHNRRVLFVNDDQDVYMCGKWKFSEDDDYGKPELDFTNASVTGLGVVPVFG